MGWQSYVLFYNSDAEKKDILDVIQKHNICENMDEVGEEIIGIVDVKIVKPIKINRCNVKYRYAILCGNGGGRSSTFEWLYKNGIYFERYTDKWETHFEENVEKSNESSEITR